MAGIEVATGELVTTEAKFVFDFNCPKCGNDLIIMDKWGYFCNYPGECDWKISHGEFRQYGVNGKGA